jgi:hypothetical protein
VAYQVNGSRVEWNPAAARLRELTEKMPNASVTEFGNVNVKARVDSRSTRSTYIVEDSTNSRGQTITRAEYDRVAAIQDAHIAKSHMVVVDGTPVTVLIVGLSGPARRRPPSPPSSAASPPRTISSR